MRYAFTPAACRVHSEAKVGIPMSYFDLAECLRVGLTRSVGLQRLGSRASTRLAVGYLFHAVIVLGIFAAVKFTWGTMDEPQSPAMQLTYSILILSSAAVLLGLAAKEGYVAVLLARSARRLQDRVRAIAPGSTARDPEVGEIIEQMKRDGEIVEVMGVNMATEHPAASCGR